MAKFDPNKYLTKLKGKDYLEVKYRLVWFREEFPNGQISTKVIELTDQRCVIQATVAKGTVDGGYAEGIGSETPKDFGDYIEKAETKAIGRALAALGYGTQFAPELDEGERIVDSPVQRATAAPTAPKPPTPSASTPVSADAAIAMRRLHAVGKEHGFAHEELRLICDREERLANKRPITTLKDAPTALLHYVADLIEKNPANQRAWLNQQAKQSAELLPGMDAVPNPTTANHYTDH